MSPVLFEKRERKRTLKQYLEKGDKGIRYPIETLILRPQ